MKKLVVFGGTGRTGLAVLTRASQDPELQVTAYLRKPEKVPVNVRSKIKIVLGNVLDADQVANVIEGQDAVISCLGKGFNICPTTLISEGVKNIVQGMREHGVKRIVLVGVAFLLPGRKTMFILKEITADHERALNYLKKCKDIDWIMSMPPQIIDAPYTDTYKVAINKLCGSKKATTHDIAHWMLTCVKDEEVAKEYKHQLVGISSFLSFKQGLTRLKIGYYGLFAFALVGTLWYSGWLKNIFP
ncbi:unnamed protein product [Clavelina lepadiformis]|uniref:NAD(P)-binding domain-containing protein n=1 Tax=Clavelina lepadiformis TaxID=159417 RepID=A0ABP0G8N8_CLALP